MYSYYVFALCEEPAEKNLTPYSRELTASRIRKRIRQCLASLKSKLARLPHIAEIIEQPEAGAVIVNSEEDLSEDFIGQGVYAISLGLSETLPLGAKKLFYARATLAASPQNQNANAVLQKSQQEIEAVIKKDFGGEPGPYPFTFLIVVGPDSRWLNEPQERSRAWLKQLKKIEAALKTQGLTAEIGIIGYPGQKLKL